MSLFDRWLGRGGASVTIPVMDGPLLPNRTLETAEVLAELPDVDSLAVREGALYAASDARLMKLAGAGFELIETFKGPISALAARGSALAVGVDGQGVEIRGGAYDGVSIPAINCVTALAWLNDRELIVCNGSATLGARQWRRSLMQLDASGSLLKIDLQTKWVSQLHAGLAWPAGVALAGDRLYVSESWRHRIVQTSLSGAGMKPALSNLPAYPARLTASADGGFWLSFYANRNQLVEFILREPTYRKRMIAEIPEPFWMAPSLASGRNFKEPMQGSQLKQMGILKPYSAGRSYGLVAYCDESMAPLGSFHSRADGKRHGTIAACEFDGALIVASKGSHAALRIADPQAALKE